MGGGGLVWGMSSALIMWLKQQIERMLILDDQFDLYSFTLGVRVAF